MKPSKGFLSALLATGMIAGWLAVHTVPVETVRHPAPVHVPRRNVPLDEAASPTVTTVTGVLSNPQFKIALRALRQRGGVDTLAEPEVVTKHDWREVNRMYYDQTITFDLPNPIHASFGSQLKK